jgi:hypothetical protein
MAYSQNSINLITPVMGLGTTNTAQVWTHVSADAVATVIAAGYITNGDDIGMRVNDVVLVVDSNLGLVDVCIVTVVTAAGLVTMVNGT